MPQNVAQVKIRGLNTFSSDFEQTQPETLQDCDNIVINRDNIAEPRRGLNLYGDAMGTSPTTDFARQLFSYKKKILRHYGSAPNGVLQFDDGSGNFTSFSGNYNEVVSGLRMRGQEVSGNFYFTTDNGIKKISASTSVPLSNVSGFITDAGGVKGLDLQASIDYTQTGFFSQDSTVAYRVVWGITDSNNNLILGVPSQRVVLKNNITDLLLQDFNDLLNSLDAASAANTGGSLSDTNYYSTLNISLTGSISDIYTGLNALASKLDLDMSGSATANDIATLVETALVATGAFTSPGPTSGVFTLHNIAIGAAPAPSTTVNDPGFSAVISTNAVAQITQIAPIAGADFVSSGTSDYFDIYTAGDISHYRIWFQSGTSVAPSGGPGIILKEIIIAGTETISEVAILIQNVLNSFGGFNANSFGSTVTATNTTEGTTSAATETVTNAAFSVSTTTTGQNQEETITCVAGSQYKLTGTSDYFDVSSTSTTYRVWFQSGKSIQPGGAGVTFLRIDVPGTTYAGIASNHTAPGNILNSQILLDVQLFYDEIVNALLVETIAHITAAAQTAGNFQTSTQSTTAKIESTIPQAITNDSYFYQVYRTALSTSTGAGSLDDLDPGDEMGLVYQANTTSTERSAGYITFSDVVPDSFRGANLYTNPQSGEGILQANEVPPLAKDLALFKNSVFYANTRTKHRLNIALLGVANLVSGTSTITITDGIVTNTYTFTDTPSGPLDVQISAASTPGQQVDETARNLVKAINRNSGEAVYAFYLSGPTDVPGSIELETRELGTNAFYILADSTTTGESFNPVLSPSNTISDISVADPTVITSTAHGLIDGDEIVITNSDSTPSVDGIWAITFIDANTFSITVPVTVIGTTGVFKKKSLTIVSDNEVKPNRVYYSKSQQPEAVPIVNFFDVGSKDNAIVRILPLRDSLFVLKEDAIYRVSGQGAISGFSQTLFDSSTNIKAPDSAVVLNNQIIMYANQGISIVTDTGVSIISRAIENLLIPNLLHPNFSDVTFGVSYESDRSYMIWTTTNFEDTQATQCFRYNTFTNSWTNWKKGKSCGLVIDEKLYLGANDTNFIEQERKNFNRTDYADREFIRSLNSESINGTVISIGSIGSITVGDVLFQEQYLTIYKLNQLLQKLDDDVGVADSDYLSSLGVSTGADLRVALTDLADKLDADTGVSDTTFASSISGFGTSFQDTQAAYNVIANKLNSDMNVSFSNYPLSTGTDQFEAIITSIDLLHNQITLMNVIPLISGNCIIYQHIPISITFNPQFFGNSENFKQVSEAKFMFSRTDFTQADISYSSDLSPYFETFTIRKQGNGGFGQQTFGGTNFGGDADKAPFRTLVPRNKQRCRFVSPKIEHNIARENLILLGYSMYFSSYSQRPYRD